MTSRNLSTDVPVEAIASPAQESALRRAAERLYWRVSSLWQGGVQLVPPDLYGEQLKRVIALLREHVPAERFGDYLEFGVYNGCSMGIAYHALQAAGLSRARLIGFDSFRGMPESSDPEAETFKRGLLYYGERHARASLRRAGVDMSRVVLVKGWYEETLTAQTAQRLGLGEVHLAMIDCVIYSSTATVLEFLMPRLGDPAVLVFDDWTAHEMHLKRQGQQRALAEFLAAHPHYRAEEIGGYAPHARIFMLSGAHAARSGRRASGSE
jgi:hypothetical protein